LLQNRLPVDHTLNRYVASDSEVAALESAIRATGTFSFITGLEVCAFVGIWAGMVLLSVAPGAGTQAGGLVTIFAAFGCGLASISRAPLIAGAGVLSAWAWSSRTWFKHSRAICLSTLIITVMIIAGLAPMLLGLGRAVVERHETGGDTFVNRAFGQLNEAVEAAAMSPFGAGCGSEQIGGNYASKGVMTFTTFENQMPRVILETGVLGLAGFLMICAGAILALQNSKKGMSNSRMRATLLATQLLLACLFYTNVVFNHTASAFAWLIFAAVMAGAKPENSAKTRDDSNRIPHGRNRFRCPHTSH
jgi:hypothetical protein